MEAHSKDVDKPNIDWITGNVFNPAFNQLVASPGDILIDAANAVIKKAGGRHVFSRIENRAEAKADGFWGTSAQVLVNGASSAVVYALAGKAVGVFLKKAASPYAEILRETAGEETEFSLRFPGVKPLVSTMENERVHQVIGAAAYDYAREPGQGQTRRGDMLGSVAAFSVYGLLNPRAELPLTIRLLSRYGIGGLGAAAQMGAATWGGNQFNWQSVPQELETAGVMNMLLPGIRHGMGQALAGKVSDSSLMQGNTFEKFNNSIEEKRQLNKIMDALGSRSLRRLNEVANSALRRHMEERGVSGLKSPEPGKEPDITLDPSATADHLKEVFQNLGYFADQKQLVQLSASLHAKPVGGAFLSGPAGSGKTFLTESVSQALGAKYFYKQAFPGTREDNLLVDVLPDQNAPSGVKEYPGVLVQAANFLKENPNQQAILVLDEWDKTRPSADSILLDFLQKGRISHGSVNIALTPEQMSRLKVFIAMNNERELSEPLLRRLPMIDFEQPDVSLVEKALQFSHPNHELIPSLLSLYQHSQWAQMSKPVTIQELRQFIDANDSIKKQGVVPDWNDLVRNFITKTEENQLLLQQSESVPKSIRAASKKEVPRLSPWIYRYPEPETSKTNSSQAEMPPLYSLLPLAAPGKAIIAPALDENTAGIVAHHDDNFDSTVRLTSAPADDPSSIGDIARVAGDKDKVIAFANPVQLSQSAQFLERFWGQPGEMAVIEPKASWQDIRQLQDKGLQITEFSSRRIVGKSPGLNLVWTPEKGAEMIVDLDKGSATENPITKLGLNRTL